MDDIFNLLMLLSVLTACCQSCNKEQPQWEFMTPEEIDEYIENDRYN